MNLRFLGIALALVAISGSCRADCGSGSRPVFYPFMTAQEGVLYTQTAPGKFLAVNLNDHTIAWTFVDRNLCDFTKPVFSTENVVVAATRGSESEVISLKGGTTQWRVPFVNLAGNASPVQCGSSVLLGDFWNRRARALDVLTGQTRWEDQQDLFVHPPAVEDQRAIYVVGDKNSGEASGLVTVNCSDGSIQKKESVLGIGVSRSPILLYNGAAILMGYDLRSGTTLVSVDRATMKTQWRLRLKDEVARYAPVIENDQLILSGENLWIVSLKDGKISFRKTLASPSVPPAVAPDRVVLQTSPRRLSAIDLHTYKRLWSRSVTVGVVSNLLYHRGTVYFQTSSNQLMAIDPVNGTTKWSIALNQPEAAAK